jgi:hypothetical protein
MTEGGHAPHEGRRGRNLVVGLFLAAAVGTLLPACGGPPLSARIAVPSTTMARGSAMLGKVIVTNDTGHALHANGCRSPFLIALGNAKISPSVAWLDCLQRITIPTGESTWMVSVSASYLACGERGPLPRCIHGYPPPLPPGAYEAVLYQRPHVVPTPQPIRIRVTP